MEKALYNAGEEAEIAEKLEEYEEFRINKQFVQSDALRKEIEAVRIRSTGYERRLGDREEILLESRRSPDPTRYRSPAPCHIAKKQQLKLPPQNLDAEATVLGSILIDKNAIFHVADILVPQDFYSPAHEKIYRCDPHALR